MGGVLAAGISGHPASMSAGPARPESSFLTVQMPCEPKDESGVRDTAVGDIHHNTLSCRSGDASLSISASVLPPAVMALTTEKTLYRRARNELLKNFDGTKTVWKTCEHAGWSCWKLHYDTGDDGNGRARLFLDEDVLVVTNAVYVEDEEIATDFLDSAK